MGKQSLADALAAKSRAHEQIFQEDARPAGERGEIEEPDRKSNRLAAPLGDLAEQARVVAKQRLRDSRFRRLDLMRELFVFGKLADQRKDESGLIGARAVNRKRHPLLTPRLRP